MFKKLLTETEASKLLNVSLSKLRRDRSLGIGLPFTRIGRTVRYSEDDITDYLKKNTVMNSFSNR